MWPAINSCNLIFPDATFTGKKLLGLQGGISMQYNFNSYITLRTAAQYTYTHCPLPSPDDAYGKGFAIEQQSVLVPLILQLGIQQMGMGIYFGIGGYYGREIKGCFYGNIPAAFPSYSTSHDPNQMGWVFNFGMRLGGHWHFDGIWYSQINNIFQNSSGMPGARNSLYTVNLGYCF